MKGLQEILKEIGGKKVWNSQLEEKVEGQLKQYGYENNKKDIEAQLRVALEAYTTPASEERKIIMAHKSGLVGYLELCKHHDLRTDASANRLRSEIMELGKASKTRKEVKEALINLEAKRTRLAVVMDPQNELQPAWLQTILT